MGVFGLFFVWSVDFFFLFVFLFSLSLSLSLSLSTFLCGLTLTDSLIGEKNHDEEEIGNCRFLIGKTVMGKAGSSWMALNILGLRLRVNRVHCGSQVESQYP